MGILYEDLCPFPIIFLSDLLRMRSVSGKSGTENQNIHFMLNNFFFRQLCSLWHNGTKYCTARHATDDNTVHAHRILDTQGYKYTLTICNTHCFSTTTMVVRMRLSVTLYNDGLVANSMHSWSPFLEQPLQYHVPSMSKPPRGTKTS